MKFLNKYCIKCTSGQGSVEFAIVTAAVLSLFVALSVLWKFLNGGILIEHALACASHHLQNAAFGIIGDVFSC